jgi:DNA mismatch endonuclease, patch repair protein
MTEDAAVRRRTMQAVRSENTKPELAIRHMVTGLGYRYRLHRKDLPGTPDLAFISRRKAVFVHGCFWHGHDCPRGARTPKTNRDYWTTKISKNRIRDEAHRLELKARGWRSLIIWECELKGPLKIQSRLSQFLEKHHESN